MSTARFFCFLLPAFVALAVAATVAVAVEVALAVVVTFAVAAALASVAALALAAALPATAAAVAASSSARGLMPAELGLPTAPLEPTDFVRPRRGLRPSSMGWLGVAGPFDGPLGSPSPLRPIACAAAASDDPSAIVSAFAPVASEFASTSVPAPASSSATNGFIDSGDGTGTSTERASPASPVRAPARFRVELRTERIDGGDTGDEGDEAAPACSALAPPFAPTSAPTPATPFVAVVSCGAVDPKVGAPGGISIRSGRGGDSRRLAVGLSRDGDSDAGVADARTAERERERDPLDDAPEPLTGSSPVASVGSVGRTVESPAAAFRCICPCVRVWFCVCSTCASSGGSSDASNGSGPSS